MGGEACGGIVLGSTSDVDTPAGMVHRRGSSGPVPLAEARSYLSEQGPQWALRYLAEGGQPLFFEQDGHV